MTALADYQNSFTRARLRREDGILEVSLGASPGESLVWDEAAHRELPELFGAIADDRGNRVMILTGSGDEFCVRGDGPDGTSARRRGGQDLLGGQGTPAQPPRH